MRLLFAILTVAALVAFAQNKKDDVSKIGDRNVGNCLNFYSIEKEIALGKQLAEEVARQSKLYLDPIVGEKVNRIGQNLARNSDAKVPFTFRVVEDDVPNAFACASDRPRHLDVVFRHRLSLGLAGLVPPELGVRGPSGGAPTHGTPR